MAAHRGTFSKRCGFTLIEVIVAIGIFASVALSIVALLALGTESVAENSDRSAAYRLVGAFEEKLASDGFASVYESIRDDPESDFFLYTYAGHATELREDGTAVPAGEAVSDDSVDYRLEVGFRKADDTYFEDDVGAALGAFFRVRLTALPPDPSEDASGFTLPSLTSYRDPVLRVFARIYVEPSADVAGLRPLNELPEVLTLPLAIPR